MRGCSRVSEGCRNCYAEVAAGRFSVAFRYRGLWICGKTVECRMSRHVVGIDVIFRTEFAAIMGDVVGAPT